MDCSKKEVRSRSNEIVHNWTTARNEGRKASLTVCLSVITFCSLTSHLRNSNLRLLAFIITACQPVISFIVLPEWSAPVHLVHQECIGVRMCVHILLTVCPAYHLSSYLFFPCTSINFSPPEKESTKSPSMRSSPTSPSIKDGNAISQKRLTRHVAPFWHGSWSHVVSSISQFFPVVFGGHLQV